MQSERKITSGNIIKKGVSVLLALALAFAALALPAVAWSASPQAPAITEAAKQAEASAGHNAETLEIAVLGAAQADAGPEAVAEANAGPEGVAEAGAEPGSARTAVRSGAVLAAAPLFQIALNVLEHEFTTAIEGYASTESKAVTVSNTGDQPTGALTLSLAGDMSAFSMSAAGLAPIPAGGSASFSVSTAPGLQAGDYSATVVVSGNDVNSVNLTVKFRVNAPAGAAVLDRIEVTTPPAKSVYILGETLNLSGTVVTAYYKNNTSKAVTGYTASPANGSVLNTAGQRTITFTYTENGVVKTVTTAVTVNSAAALDRIAITAQPSKKTYNAGETLSLSGMIVTAYYTNGTSKSVTGYSTTPASGAALNAVGTQTVTVSYSEQGVTKSTSTTVTVNSGAALSRISITALPTKRTFNVGESLNLAGMIVTAYYADNTYKNVTGFTASPPNGSALNTSGTFPVTITYSERGVTKSDSYTVTVGAASSQSALLSIVVTTQPTQRAYTVGENLNLAGMAITAYYANNTSKKVYGYSTSPINGAKLNSTGTQYVTITYSENGVTRSISTTVTVNPAPGAAANNQPASQPPANNANQGNAAQQGQIQDQSPPRGGLSGAANNPFTDVSENDWYYNEVIFVYTNGLMIGTYTNPMMFSPHMNLTRGMIVTILHRMTGGPGAAGLPDTFTDVAAGAWYTDPVKWAAANGVVQGYGGGLFGPDDPVTREQLAAILFNYSQSFGYGLPVVRGSASFSDRNAIAGYARDAVERLYAAGVINGKLANAFDPAANATRAEFSAMLYRFLTTVGLY